MIVKRALTALLALSMLQGELASAASATAAWVQDLAARPARPMSAPKSKEQAVLLIKKAETTSVASYFQSGDSATNVLRFQNDLIVVAKANEEVGIVDQAEAFKAWWAQNSKSILERRQFGQPSLQGFFSEVYLLYKIDATNAKKDPSTFTAWLADHVSNPLVRQVSKVTFNIFAEVFGTIGNSFKNALTFAIVAGIASALVEPAVRPIREKAAQIGSKYLGKVGMTFNRILFSQQTLLESQTAVNDAKKEFKAARQLVSQMGYDMTAQQYEENFSKLKEAWNAANQVWLKTNPEAFRNGRSVMTDGLILRTNHFTLQAMVAINGAETHRQGYEATIDRIVDQSQDKAAVHKTSEELLAAVEKRMNLERESEAKAKAIEPEVTALKAKLVGLGATQAQVDRIETNRRRELANYRHTATSLATAVINDLQYEEYNRALPQELFELYSKLKNGFNINFFHKEFRHEIVAELDRLGFQIQVKGEQISAELEKRRSSQPRVVREEAKPTSATGKLKSVLSRLSRTPGTRTAAARQGTLDQRESDPIREAAEHARK